MLPHGVAICIPGKDNYMQLMAYTSIPLLSCMGSEAEKVVTEWMSEEAERRRLLSNASFGTRKEQSAIDAVAIMVGSTHAAWKIGT